MGLLCGQLFCCHQYILFVFVLVATAGLESRHSPEQHLDK